jgi:hypothetical protein
MRLRSLYRRFPSYRKRMYERCIVDGSIVPVERRTWFIMDHVQAVEGWVQSRLKEYSKPSNDDYRPFIRTSPYPHKQ